jgi:hypothetical protein
VKLIYSILCLLGAAIPLGYFWPWLAANGINLQLFIRELFANRVAGFFGLDVAVSSLVLWVFVFTEGRRENVRHLWAPVAANLLAGVSLGLPLFLLMRELARSKSASASS